MRRPGTDRSDSNFSELTKLAVWRKGRPITGYDPARWRYDACGAPMDYSRYGDTSNQYGWEIDHIYPVAAGGGDELANLQPLQWENNRAKSDNVGLVCVVPRKAS